MSPKASPSNASSSDEADDMFLEGREKRMQWARGAGPARSAA
jgi:hypothetical protein